MLNLAQLSLPQLQAFLAELGEPAFRARQVARWIWKEGVSDFAKMSNLSAALRAKLGERAVIRFPQSIAAPVSSDGTIKYLLRLDDGKSIETVWIPREEQERVTVCVSVQVGCNMGCTFCMTGQQKVERDLTAGEIAAQLRVMPNPADITNVVLMGMGEPFDNYDNVVEALKLLTDEEIGMGLAHWRITVSTSGLVPRIADFLKDTKSRLAISLNASNDVIRSKIMPVNKAFPIAKLMEAIRVNFKDRRRRFNRITFEYILIHELNDSQKNAEELAALLKGLPCKVNLMLYNENPHVPYARPTPERVEAFRAVLEKRGILNFLRVSRGRDVAGACGQLASETKKREYAQQPEARA